MLQKCLVEKSHTYQKEKVRDTSQFLEILTYQTKFIKDFVILSLKLYI